MRKFSKIILAICGVMMMFAVICTGAGFVLGGSPLGIAQMARNGELTIGGHNWSHFPFGSGFSLISWDDEDWDDEDYDWDEEELSSMVNETYAADEVKNMKLDIKYSEVRIEESEDHFVSVKVDANSRHEFSCKLDGDTVKLSDEVIDFSNKHSKVIITIPEGMQFDDFDLDLDAGKVDMDVDFSAKNMKLNIDAGQLTASDFTVSDTLKLDVGAGQMQLEDIKTQDVKMDCGMGQINFEGRITGDADCDCGMGNISLDLEGSQRDFNYELKCGVGAIRLNDSSYTSLGTSQKIENGANQDMTLDCGVGEIDLSIN